MLETSVILPIITDTRWFQRISNLSYRKEFEEIFGLNNIYKLVLTDAELNIRFQIGLKTNIYILKYNVITFYNCIL